MSHQYRAIIDTDTEMQQTYQPEWIPIGTEKFIFLHGSDQPGNTITIQLSWQKCYAYTRAGITQNAYLTRFKYQEVDLPIVKDQTCTEIREGGCISKMHRQILKTIDTASILQNFGLGSIKALESLQGNDLQQFFQCLHLHSLGDNRWQLLKENHQVFEGSWQESCIDPHAEVIINLNKPEVNYKTIRYTYTSPSSTRY